ncbi:hypothetical protein PIB30_014329 [Stylosanthes scabra]|uniref:Uncharacterized protein n=1 Tax=Stylosanthes scabra TaxID=79078 RepID=A0ABU6R6N5_9FABA|nr:hypothetical protein [Stylosanthes scabra]
MRKKIKFNRILKILTTMNIKLQITKTAKSGLSNQVTTVRNAGSTQIGKEAHRDGGDGDSKNGEQQAGGDDEPRRHTDRGRGTTGRRRRGRKRHNETEKKRYTERRCATKGGGGRKHDCVE